ncbi:MAG: GntR family transcriptional regulator [Chloroflexi bacterium]|nr:MAG: GntR family transcriptional regulator [Chloroflexota bacterium]TMD19207.1 MAG: GntR family transcriptional regulator [Chloroflexota bacterium]TMF00206.1 MAG: GntR family transcriptional regulator [Chloroflexota bacterium]
MRAEPAVLSSLSRPRAWEEAVQLLRSKILSEELPPGTRLVEATYAKHLGISQGTFREALARLEHEGLVISIPRRGTYVAALPVDTVNQLYELRELVEPLAVRLAMKNLKKDDVDYLEHQIGRLASRVTSERVDADMAFHRRLYELTGFPPLQNMWPQIEVLTRKILSMARRLGSVENTQHNHQSIMRALVKGDEEALERAIRAHMQQTTALFEGRARADDIGKQPAQPPRNAQ